MSKIIAKLQSPIDKVSGHKYTGFTIKAPFINFSFAPTISVKPGRTGKGITPSRTGPGKPCNKRFFRGQMLTHHPRYFRI